MGEGASKVAYTDGNIVYKIAHALNETEAEDTVKWMKYDVNKIKELCNKINNDGGLPVKLLVLYQTYKQLKDNGKPFQFPEDKSSYEYVKGLKGYFLKYKANDLGIEFVDTCGIIKQTLAPKFNLVLEGFGSNRRYQYVDPKTSKIKQYYNIISIVLREKYNEGVDLRNSGNIIIDEVKKVLFFVDV